MRKLDQNQPGEHVDPCRRAFLGNAMFGLGGIALQSLLSRSGVAGPLSDGGLFRDGLHHRPTAKRVIVIFCSGGLSQHDLFDPKPLLDQRWGEELPDSVRKEQRITGVTVRQGALPVAGTAFEFARHGESGMQISELLPHTAALADDLCLVRSQRNESVLHEAATTCFFTGTTQLHRPSMGAWATYALGSETEELPEFVTFLTGRGQPLHQRVWGAGFLPSRHQGVQFRSGGDPVLYVENPSGMSEDVRNSVIERVRELDALERDSTGDPEIDTRLNAYELAARMQTSVPDLMDLETEPEGVLEMYGARPGRGSFANNCLLARRLVERGVRFVQICDRGWDHHFGIPRALRAKCNMADKPVAALVSDLKQRGLLDDTIVVFAGEFGRTSYCEGPLTAETYGRDHNNRVGAFWVAGGGFQGGLTYGATDEWGWDTVENPVHVHDLQATLLHCLGLDHKRLTHRFQGRDFRLTDVSGRVVHDLLA